jgi:hypothetical protein
MVERRGAAATVRDSSERHIRDQEVVRANRDLAAYFRGRRTEREARAALKIIKAFIRDRERQSPKARPPLPGAGAVSMPVAARRRTARVAAPERSEE